ncbi:MFS transporter, sugar porter (SP) family [Pustulibacterium marinum]|uniref:MFS transporter, sugar porter (SP) family n=1 Tax=Pustulibacterium marinum TaxID=1224947 RepID=A0A1I7H6H3_9FLAO|nr:sugar porter family MFS transporter [Pustulibacterium marinum]SFU56282.1 MFS transporter, sugar porter (SP) family [Pustulibacterium marinum]
MNKLYAWSVSAALAGFLFGFDTVVISGADQQLQELWNTSDTFHGMVVMGMALWGTVLGALTGSYPTNRWGRKNTLLIIGILYLVSALGSGLATDPYIFAFFRFIGGLGVGASTIAAPAYVSEIAPPEKRGFLVSLYQFNIVLGILIAFLSNYLLRNVGSEPWRWMVGIEAVPALLYCLFIFLIPRSPRWLISKARLQEARKVLGSYLQEDEIEKRMLYMQTKNDGYDIKESIFYKKYRFPLLLAFLIAFFNQLSGINALLYYAPRIFETAGLGESTSLLSSIGVGLVNLIFTMLGVYLIDKAGRKQLLIIGSIGYIISLSLVSMAFLYHWGGLWVPIFLFLFIASHAIGQGAIIWVFISEIFPNHLRASGQAFGSSTHWVLAAIIPSLIPLLFSTVGPAMVFGFFAIMMVLQLFFAIFMMPETKGKSLEDLSEELAPGKRTMIKKKVIINNQ